ncbi:MAG TPA: DUF2934 domain-containing protein [Pseudacidobacterium sp.]|jgi:hypothetical protein|nr:DUF2934 domain-containing protein [Pseudacidobacterium sp.]
MPTPKVEKAEKTAKTRKTPAKKKVAVLEQVTIYRPTHHEIAVLAHQFWVERGYSHGHDEQDWFRAEQELLKVAS